MIFCTKCHSSLKMGKCYLEIEMQDLMYVFCAFCVQQGYCKLILNDYRSRQDLVIMKGFRDFLEKHKLIAQA